jgi:HAMP domain-containing protein
MRYRLLGWLTGGVAGLALLAIVALLGLDAWLSRGATVRRGHIYSTAGGEPVVVYGARSGTRCTVDGRLVAIGPRWRRWTDRFWGRAGGLRLPADGRSRSLTCERAVRVAESRRAALAQTARPWWTAALFGVVLVALVVRAWSGRALRKRLRTPVPVARGVWPVRPPAPSGHPGMTGHTRPGRRTSSPDSPPKPGDEPPARPRRPDHAPQAGRPAQPSHPAQPSRPADLGRPQQADHTTHGHRTTRAGRFAEPDHPAHARDTTQHGGTTHAAPPADPTSGRTYRTTHPTARDSGHPGRPLTPAISASSPRHGTSHRPAAFPAPRR